MSFFCLFVCLFSFLCLLCVQVEVKRARPKEKRSAAAPPQPVMGRGPVQVDTKKVFLGGLSRQTTKEDIIEALKDYGIVSAQVMTKKGSEKPRGFAFAYFDSVESARAVADMHYVDILVSSL